MFARTVTVSIAAAAAALIAAPALSDTPALVGDRSIGAEDAPITIIEYASVTCPICADFHNDVLPEVKERYIDTGQVRFIFREIPTPPVEMAMAGFLVARCVPEERYFDLLNVQFARREQLLDTVRERFNTVGPRAVYETYRDFAASAGISQADYDRCIRDADEVNRIRAVGDHAEDRYGVTGTPAFVVNDTYVADLATLADPPFIYTIEDFAAYIDPLLEDAGGAVAPTTPAGSGGSDDGHGGGAHGGDEHGSDHGSDHGGASDGHGDAHGAEAKGGLPQLRTETWPSQIFWLIVIFGGLYFLVSRVALPPIRDVIEDRRDRIADDLDEAATLKRDAEQAGEAYERTLADARAKAHTIAAETRGEIDAQIAQEIAASDAEADARAAEAETKIRAAADAAMAEADTVAADAAKAVVSRLTGSAPNDAAVAAAVKSSSTPS